jgi:hypothetical protein
LNKRACITAGSFLLQKIREKGRGIMTQKTYGFQAQLKVGELGEKTLDAFFAEKGYEIKNVTMKEQRRGIDRIFVKDGKEMKVEYKTDALTARTGNVFIETVSSNKSGAPGWAVKTQADYVVYYVPGYKQALLLKPEYLRSKIPYWLFEYRQRPVRNKGYMTFGIPVPWEVLRENCQVLDIDVSVDEVDHVNEEAAVGES